MRRNQSFAVHSEDRGVLAALIGQRRRRRYRGVDTAALKRRGRAMPDNPLAFHITFGTYGTRLHGDERGTVDRSRNRPGDPIIGRNEHWERIERRRLRYDPIILARPQRGLVEGALRSVCEQGGWRFHVAAAQPNHVHLMLTAEAGADSKTTRRLVKRWLSERLNARWPLPDGARWWSTGGSVKWIWDQWYAQSVWDYIDAQRVIRGE